MLICGDVHTAGSTNDLHVMLSTDTATSELLGAGRELLGYGGRACVRARPVRGLMPNSLEVIGYRLAGDGKHEPIIGTIRKNGGGYRIVTRDGRRFAVVAADPAALESAVDRRVWISAEWSHGALQLRAIGPLGAP